MKHLYRSVLIFFLIFVLSNSLFANSIRDQHEETKVDPFIDLMLNQVAFMEGRITSLAEAIPEDTYSWRPGEGVRSTSEQLVHTIAASYFIPSMMGGDKPEHITQDLEKTLTDKDDILKELKSSFTAATKFLKEYDTSKYEEMVKTPFGEYTQRNMILILNNHYHEHLGQLIAYARVNGVVPPWSQKEN